MNKFIQKITNIIMIPQNFFVVFGAVGCLLFSIMVPVLQVPDEYTHFSRLCDFYSCKEIYDDVNENFFINAELNGIIGEYDNKVDVYSYLEYGSKAINHNGASARFNVGPETIRYLPFSIGFFLSYLLHLPVLICFQVGELMSIIFFLFMGYHTIRIMPKYKYIMLFWLLSPMVLQQCSSINYDCVLIPTCFLLTAYIFRIKFADESVGWKKLLIIMGVLLVILLIKPPYVLMGGLLLIIPLERINIHIGKLNVADFIKKYRIILIILGVLGVLALGYVFRNNTYIKLIYVTIRKPNVILRLFKTSFEDLNHYYIYTTVGSFGWLDSTVSVPFEIVFFIVLTCIFIKDGLDKYGFDIKGSEKAEVSEKSSDIKGADTKDSDIEAQGNTVTALNKVWISVLVFCIFLFIFLSMLTWSFYVFGMDRYAPLEEYFENIASLRRFDGVQGRYFIPFIPMLLLGFKREGEGLSEKSKVYLMIYYVVTFVYLYILLRNRYWVA